ncbi:LemA family protein [Spiroplasma gladiatoris]|uniref:LemA family protein n=1 Tax=Spiroplasma gladiatoris TaxID=2143 RepID=A0A4P7AIB1_9MOLU|nr:LemA family protein [Spiroplasma gladiatoris]QBQ07468.1 LemA family protein [Spiroplasma gladiatoris]
MIAQDQELNNINNNANQPIKASFIGMVFWVFLWFLIIPLIVHIALLNKIKKAKVKTQEQEANIDVYLKQRRDLLLKLIESVKGSIKFEKEILNTLTAMRTGQGLDQMQKKATILNSISENIKVQIENYPNLKSTSAIKDFIIAIESLEMEISNARDNYNQAVSEYNQILSSYPSNVVAKFNKEKYRSFFEVADWDRDDIEINL